MTPQEVLAPITDLERLGFCLISLGSVVVLAVGARALSGWSKRRDQTREVSGREFLGDDHPDDTDLDDLDANIYYGTPLPDRDRWVVPPSTVLSTTPVEEVRADLEAAFAEPTVRYVITRPAIGWDDHEATRGEWIRIECEFGLRDDNPGPDAQPVTDRIAWNGSVMGKIVRPWADPNAAHLGIAPEPDHDDTIPTQRKPINGSKP